MTDFWLQKMQLEFLMKTFSSNYFVTGSVPYGVAHSDQFNFLSRYDELYEHYTTLYEHHSALL